MFVTGFMGSPRKKGNTSQLLTGFMDILTSHGADTRIIHVPEKTIHPCTGCSLCEKKGVCHFDDDMTNEILPLMRQSDIIIIATPIYFYNCPAELKALIDRSQTLWSRKYKLRLKDPCESLRRGYMLAVGATKGTDLFDSMRLTLKYFFRGISAGFAGELTYDRVEDPGDIKQIPTLEQDIETAVEELIKPFTSQQKTLLFTCNDNSGRSQMAGAFARQLAGNQLRILTAGSSPGRKTRPEIIEIMAEKGIDIGFLLPRYIDSVIQSSPPDVVVSLVSGDETCIATPGAECIIWQIPDPAGQPEDTVRNIRDDIEQKVTDFISGLLPDDKQV